MRTDMRVPTDVRVELRVTGVPIGGHLLAGIPSVQRSHREGAHNVPDHQLDGVQQLRMGVVWRMVSDQAIRQLSTVSGHCPAERHRDRS